MKRIKTALFSLVLFSILLTSTPSIAANEFKTTGNTDLKIADSRLKIDTGMLKTSIPDIDPHILISGNTEIDSKMLLAP